MIATPYPYKPIIAPPAFQFRSGIWDAGRFPEKAAKAVLIVLDNALANAEYKGMESEKMRIFHAGTKKGRTIRGWMPRAMGRATPKNTETVSVEMVLTEVKS